jgi:hypothetical protein
MDFSETYSWVALPCSIKKAVMDGDSNVAVSYMLWACTNEHCLIVFEEMASDQIHKFQ